MKRALCLPIVIKILIILTTLIGRLRCAYTMMRALSYYLLNRKLEAYSRPHSQLKGNGVFSFKMEINFTWGFLVFIVSTYVCLLPFVLIPI